MNQPIEAPSKMHVELAPEIVELDNRRIAFEYAHKLMAGANGMRGIVNAASILGVADMYSKWLNDGSLPDLAAEAEATYQFAWDTLKAGFPPDVLAQVADKLKGTNA